MEAVGTPLSFNGMALSNRKGTKRSWTPSEKRILLILRRFFDLSWSQIAELMNHIFGTASKFTEGMLSTYRYKMYFDFIYRKLPNFNFWESVYGVPLGQIGSFCTEVLTIREKALEIPICLIKRRIEEDLSGFGSRKAGKGRRTTSSSNPVPSAAVSKIRRFQYSSQSEDSQLQASCSSESWIVIPSIEISTMEEEDEESSEVTSLHDNESDLISSDMAVVNLSDPSPDQSFPLPSEVSPESCQVAPEFLYRTFTVGHAGLNSAAGFVAALYADTNRTIKAPPIGNDFDTMASQHLNRVKLKGSFISFSNSLIWNVFLAVKEQQPADQVFISTIHLNTYLNFEHAGAWHAKPILQRLNQDRMMFPENTRYKGANEFLLWGCVHQDAITGTVSLQALLDARPEAHQILRLETLKSNMTVPFARRILFKDRINLDDLSIRLGFCQILVVLKISTSSSEDEIKWTVYHLVQGWVISFHSESILQAFRLWALMSSKGGLSGSVGDFAGLVAAKNAFLSGAHHAADALTEESRRRRGIEYGFQGIDEMAADENML